MRLYAGCETNTETSGSRPASSYAEFQRLACLARELSRKRLHRLDLGQLDLEGRWHAAFHPTPVRLTADGCGQNCNALSGSYVGRHHQPIVLRNTGL